MPTGPADAEPVRVGIGLIHRDGRYLIRQRPALPGSPMPGVWEFPGGKCEPGESPADAAARECAEETGLRVAIGHRRRIVRHRYPHGHVELHYYDATPIDHDEDPAQGAGFVWVEAARLPELVFPEANGPILEELARDSG